MENTAATIYCSNTRCQAPNPQSNKFCQQCRTPLIRRYLWAIGQGIEAFKLGDVIAGRYKVVQPRILLDTKPGTPPETPPDIHPSIAPYLRLSPYGLHVPQVYGRLRLGEGRRGSEIWLLEEAPIYSSAYSSGNSKRFAGRETQGGKEARQVEGQLLPELVGVWKDAPSVRQLNWLWQLATLWQPLSSEGVASSLLSPALLRVEGSIVRLLELQPDPKQAPTLQQLGQMWSPLLPGASPDVAGFLQQLCAQLTEGTIRTSDQLVALLDRALKDNGRSLVRSYQIFTRTDSGPSRPHNEDACYPPTGQLISPAVGASALAIVCDGIGGHEGGEVASHLAIDKLREQVERLPSDPENWNPTTLTLELERAACAANDLISQQNDSEHRSDRQRMGTTLVMARTAAHEIYITHVGDSRVYWITRHNCHQVTLDDDLASREVRLGYALYRSAVQQPTAGSLVQALGMAPSATLHPTVQRFVLDEDCIFLLCSDGLSDNDRVEQYWHTEILPILEGRIDLSTAGARLIQIANTQNGHDNATVALIYCKVSHSNGTGQTQLSATQLASVPTSSANTVPILTANAVPSEMKTQQLAYPASGRRPWGLLLGIVVLLGLGGVVASVLFGGFERLIGLVPSLDKRQETITSAPQADTASPASSTPSSTANPVLDSAALIQVKGKGVSLLQQPQNQSGVSVVAPAGSVLQKIAEFPDQQQDVWLRLRICSTGSGNPNTQIPESAATAPGRPQSPVGTSAVPPNPNPTVVPNRQAEPVSVGWIREADIQQRIGEDVLQIIDSNVTLTPAQVGKCAPPATSPPATPSSLQSPSPNTPKPTQSPRS